MLSRNGVEAKHLGGGATPSPDAYTNSVGEDCIKVGVPRYVGVRPPRLGQTLRSAPTVISSLVKVNWYNKK
jgi:hypothetical protein